MTKPLISRKNQKARLSFAEEHVGEQRTGDKFQFSDESKFNLFGSGRNIMFGDKLEQD